MKLNQVRAAFVALGAALAAAGLSAPACAAVDADAAQALAKKSDCFKCHAIDKAKKGPSLKKMSEKYRGKADGEEKAIKHLTTGSKVKLDDGTEEEHPKVKSTDPAAIKNLAQWMLSH